MREVRRTPHAYDAVVVGPGLNGLVAAAELAGAGWSVAVVDQRADLAGGLAADGLTVPGFVHDSPTVWHALFAASPAYADLHADLLRHGSEYLVPDGPLTATVGDDGAVVAHRDPGATVAAFELGRDAVSYLTLLRRVEHEMPRRTGSLGAGLDPAELLCPGTPEWGTFTGDEAGRLWTPWSRWTGIGDDDAAARALPALALVLHEVGLPVVRGGAVRFGEAVTGLLVERGVDLFLGSPAEHIEVSGGRARAVHAGGRRLEALGAVLASTSVEHLHTDLLTGPPTQRPARGPSGPPGVLVEAHLALGSPLRWVDQRLDATSLVHVERPGGPPVAVAQPGVLDPTRAPAGRAALWLGFEASPGDDADTALRGALAAVSRHAPGLTTSILGTHLTCRRRHTTGPGVPVGYEPLPTWRPGAGVAYRTEVDGLFHVGAFAHPTTGSPGSAAVARPQVAGR